VAVVSGDAPPWQTREIAASHRGLEPGRVGRPAGGGLCRRWNGAEIVICTATTAPKVRALSHRPDVALTIDTGDTPATARALSVRGVASVQIVEGVPAEYLAASRKALGEDALAEFERAVRGMYDQMARISIAPSWARLYDFGAGRLPTFLATLAANAQPGTSSDAD
jgi:hypothetical protein